MLDEPVASVNPEAPSLVKPLNFNPMLFLGQLLSPQNEMC